MTKNNEPTLKDALGSLKQTNSATADKLAAEKGMDADEALRTVQYDLGAYLGQNIINVFNESANLKTICDRAAFYSVIMQSLMQDFCDRCVAETGKTFPQAKEALAHIINRTLDDFIK